MAFISASLLAEPPLISLFDEHDKFTLSSPSTPLVTISPVVNNHRFNSMSLMMNPMGSTPTKDLMNFDEQSPADKLYAEIYQKNLRKFLSSGGFTIREKPSEGVIQKKEKEASSLIDDQLSIDGSSDSSNDEQGPMLERDSITEKFTAKVQDSSDSFAEYKHKVFHEVKNKEQLVCLSEDSVVEKVTAEVGDDSDYSAEYKHKVLHEMETSNQLLCLSDETTNNALSSSEGDCAMSSQANSEPETIDLVHSLPAVESTTISESRSNVEKLIDTEDTTNVLSDVVTSDYLAGESNSSEEEMKPKRRSPLSTSPPLSTCNPASKIRRLVRINLPYDSLHTMQEDPRFDGYCHAWVRRPDFCRFGVNCDFIHDYPPVLAKKYGMIAVYIGPDGKEVRNAEEFLKLEDSFVKSKRTNLDQATKIPSPGCYNENCRAFLRNDCSHGDRCWYKHPKSIIEGGKWVTKDVRKLVDGKRRTSSENKDVEKARIDDGFWRGRQSSTSPTAGSLPSETRSRVSFKNDSSQSSTQKGGRADIVPPHKINKVASKTSTLKSACPVTSKKDGKFFHNETNSDSPEEEVYYPGSACVARAASLAARSAPTKLVSVKTTTSRAPPLPHNKVPLVDTKPTSRRPAVANLKPSPIVVAPIKSNSGNVDGDYNYWGDENVPDDGADYWNSAAPSKVSRTASREQAMVVEAMTYDQLFRQETHAQSRQEYHGPHNSARSVPAFVLPPQPAATRPESETRKLLETKIALAQAKQESAARQKLIEIPEVKRGIGKMNETLIDTSTSPKPTYGTKNAGNSRGKNSSIFETQSINDNGYDTSGSGSDWTRSLKAMLAQKCEPIKWGTIQTEPKVNTLIEF